MSLYKKYICPNCGDEIECYDSFPFLYRKQKCKKCNCIYEINIEYKDIDE